MSIWDRLKTLAGSGTTIPTIASAATLNVPDGTNCVYVSGSTTVTALVVPTHLRNREVAFIGAASAAVTFTHTASATTANQMILGGGNITLGAGHILVLLCKDNGVWIVKSHSTGAGSAESGGDSTTAIASGSTTTIPDTASTFVITGTETITVLTATATVPFRRLTLIGGASAVVTFTNTNSPAATQMYLKGANITLEEQDIIVLVQQTDLSWFLESTTAA